MGCGKTRFIEHMAWRLKKPLITVSCHDDLTASDLVGRYLVKGGETVWVDGPRAKSVRAGTICYLDEIVEARRNGIHSYCITIDKEARIIYRICMAHQLTRLLMKYSSYP